MSSSIAIPAARTPESAYYKQETAKQPGSSSSGSSYHGSPRQPHQARNSPSPAQKQKMLHERRPSLLSSAISKEECNFVNVGDPEGPVRLISYLESSQGFAWNPEIFLPSYVEYDYTPLENRREPVHDILVTDEEIQSMLPQ
ncbi:hypothetical protein MKZ38_000520 [Zalerion maritima]|uniref:Uncharacterized protein n=1 Tax=Zalerion maritima TaxID=339359 RepID=A0AAD5RFJ4_9PEZI|nr:hypothetical protein MKZ38_000520 [Zalerion maritima]